MDYDEDESGTRIRIINTRTEQEFMEVLRRIVEDEESGVLVSEEEFTLVENTISSINKVKELEFGEDITKIGEAFMYNTMVIDKLSLPSSLVEISKNAFSESHFEDIIIPYNVTTIGDGAFSNHLTIKMIRESKEGIAIEYDGFEDDNTVIWGYTGD